MLCLSFCVHFPVTEKHKRRNSITALHQISRTPAFHKDTCFRFSAISANYGDLLKCSHNSAGLRIRFYTSRAGEELPGAQNNYVSRQQEERAL